MAKKILVIEDELAQTESLSHHLCAQGYEAQSTGSAQAVLETARHSPPDLIVIDLLFARQDGLEISRSLRQETTIPVLVLTADGEGAERSAEFLPFAAEILARPFHISELVSRVDACLDQVPDESEGDLTGHPQPGRVLHSGNLAIALDGRKALLDGQTVQLKPMEFELLAFFVQHIGQVLSRELILERVWGWDYIGNSRTVDVHVRWLREKIESEPANPRRIITMRGEGYRFEG